MILWILCLPMAPIFLVQGFWARRNIPRLPEGKPPNEGKFGDGRESIQVVGIGDSVIAGVGCDTLSESITASFAKALNERGGWTTRWAAYGCNGDRVSDIIEKIAYIPAHDASCVLISVGVNDVTALTAVRRWQIEVAGLIEKLRAHNNAPVLMLGVPPMGRFTGLPQPLRFALGVRAKMLDALLQRAAAQARDVYWIDTGRMFEEWLLAADGYHPSAMACDRWARQMLESVELDAWMPVN